MKYILLTLGFTLLFIFSMAAQDTITIHFAPQYQRSNDGGHGFMKLLRYDPDSIFYDGVPRQIQLPDQFFVSDTAVAFNFFTGWENPKIENATAFLFGNYSSHRPIVYIDYNHNLDFRDDGQALQFTTDSTVLVYLKNSSHQHAYFPIKFFYPKLLPEQKAQIEPMFSQMGPDAEGNEIISIDYWLADQRFNYKITDTWINGQSVKIGLFDWDCNGLYNDKGQDRIMLGNYEENFISGKLDKGAIVFQDTTLIEIGTQVYKVLDIGPAGDFLKLRKTNAAYLKPISIGEKNALFNST